MAKHLKYRHIVGFTPRALPLINRLSGLVRIFHIEWCPDEGVIKVGLFIDLPDLFNGPGLLSSRNITPPTQ